MSMLTLGFLPLFAAGAMATPALTLPEVSKGTLPYKTFSGTLCEAPTELLTVPAGQEFLITMVTTTTDGGTSRYGDWFEHNGAMLTIDGAPALAGQAIGKKSTIPVARGHGKLPVSAGSILRIQSIGLACDHRYYLQGYLIEAGSPYRAFYNNSALRRDVFTVESDKTFLLRTAAVSSRNWPNHCHVWVDGERVLDGDLWATTDRNHWGGGSPGGFASGLGTLVLSAGQTLSVGPEDPSVESQCDYYVAGEYLTP